MPKPINIGMIGYAFMGKAHSAAYRDVARYFPELKFQPVLKAICGRNQKAVKEAADQFGWESFETDALTLINRADIDIVDVSSPGWARHLKALRAGLLERRDAMAAAVRRHLGEDALPHLPKGGLHLWAKLPEGTDERAVIAAAARKGVVVSGGRESFAAEPLGPRLRLTFGGAPPEELAEGVRRLAQIL